MKHSIIIIAFGAWDYLSKCLDSIRSSHIDSYEIVIVDNLPGERTPEETAILERADFIIHPDHNLGFAKGCNVGRMQAKGEHLIFLNPDTEVYGSWADRLAQHLGSDPEVGAVGPISNFVAGGQNEVFHHGNMNPQDPMESKLLIGFCLMMRQEVFDEMGGMDSALFLGNDDLDLSWRLRLAGYRLLIAPDVFVYHAGHKTMEEQKPEHIQKLLDESTAHLKAKIQAHYGPACPSAVELWGVDFFQTRDKGPMRLSVVMIVKQEIGNLRQLIPTLSFADEIVIVDTGSVDGSHQWLGDYRAAFGTKWGDEKRIILANFDWVDDFAAARNFANSKATGDYILWLDADDRIPAESADLIRRGMDDPSERVLRKTVCFDLKLENTIEGKPHGETVFQPRIFPNLQEIRWGGKVHESIAPSINRLKLSRVPCADIRIIHTGYDTYALRAAKADRNMGILRTMPDTPQKYWDMGNAYASCEQYEEAYGLYRLALDRWEKHLEKGFRDHLAYLAGKCLYNLREWALALEWLTHTDKPDAVFMRALCLENMGGAWKPTMEAYLALPEAPDAYGTHRAFMQEEGRKKLGL
jgi:O-antigen biosynthesis protein